MFGSGDLGMGVTFSLRDNASAAAQQAGRALTGLEQNVQNASRSIQEAAGKLTSGLIATTTAVLLLIAPFASAINTSSEFNFQIAQAGAISKATAEEMDSLRQKAIQLGDATVFTALDIAKAEVTLSRAGFAVQQQLQMLDGLTDLATAGNIQLAQAADMAGNAMYMFGMKASDSARVSDVLVNAANKSNQSLENFGNAIKYLGPTANALNVSLEESAGYIMMMANSSMKGSIGTRAFGTSLANLSNPTRMAKEAMSEIGFNVFEGGNFVGFIEMTKRLDQALKGYSKETKLMYLDKIFGSEAIQEVNTLLNQEYRAIENGTEVVYKGAAALEYFTKSNLEASGTASETAKRMLDNFKGDLTLLESVIETTAIAIGTILEEPLRPFVKEMSKLVASFKALIQTQFGEYLVKITAGIAVMGASMIVLGFVTTIAVPAIWSMVTAVAALMIEFLPVIATVAAVAGAVYLMTGAFSDFKKIMYEEQAPATGFNGLLERIAATMYSVVEIWSTWNGQTFTMSEQLHNALQKIGILDFVMSLATWVIRIKEFFMSLVSGVVYVYAIFEQSFMYMKDSVGSLFDALDSIGIPLGKLTSDLSIFHVLGKIVAGTMTIMAVPFIILAESIGLVSNAIEFLIVNWKQLAMLGGGVIESILNRNPAAVMSAWQNSKFENTFNKGKMVPGVSASTGNYDFADITNRQAEIMASLGLKNNSAITTTPTAPNTQETFIMQTFLDGDKIADQILEKEKLRAARN